MSHPTEDELVDVAVGYAARDASISAHIDTCDACAATVADLRSAVGLVAAGLPDAAWQAPPATLWGRISDQLAADDLTGDDLSGDDLAGAAGPSGRQGGAPVASASGATPGEPATHSATPSVQESVEQPATPHTAAVPASPTGDPSASPAPPPSDDELGTRRARNADHSRRGRGRAVGWGAGLAAASLAIGLLTGRAIWQPEAPPAPVAQTALSTLDTKQDEGEASVVRTGQGLDLTVATATPLDAGDGYLEVWLLNADGKRMVSVGVLAPGDQGTFPISQSLIDEGYVIVDISRESFDDSPTHSGDSLLRGTLSA
ncbi:anti-sigma factor [Humibacillus xanthopallidus]|uniref:anti-sigma factor n=1 Tax=Humibacillus xanthopallidus TaxID=412689 RepID=UPI00384F1761